jgi:hypothetical protein
LPEAARGGVAGEFGTADLTHADDATGTADESIEAVAVPTTALANGFEVPSCVRADRGCGAGGTRWSSLRPYGACIGAWPSSVVTDDVSRIAGCAGAGAGTLGPDKMSSAASRRCAEDVALVVPVVDVVIPMLLFHTK